MTDKEKFEVLPGLDRFIIDWNDFCKLQQEKEDKRQWDDWNKKVN